MNIPERMTAPLMTTAVKSVAILDIGAFIWLTGSFLFIAVHLISYLYYKRQVVRNGRYVKNAVILQQYLKIKRELHIRHTLPVIEFSEAASPMVLGFFRPVLVLPDEEYSREELFFILKHELIHWKRGDVYWKLLFMAANGAHWFNPFVWIMRKEAAVDMELSCDERVTKGADVGMKKAYTETLLSTLHRGCRKNITLSTGFYGGKRIMKEGMAEQKEAELVVERGVLTGKEYALYLPVGEWQKAEADTWQAIANEIVRIGVAGFETGYPIGQILENDGFVPDEEGMEKEENGIRYRARLYESGTSVWCVEYCYPEEAEEGWGQEMRVIADTFAEVEAESDLLLGYITDLEENTVTVDLQDWLTPESEDWKPEYDTDAGFAVVDLEGADITYPIRGDCTYTILENHSGPDAEVDREAFESYLQETDFPMLWGVEVENGEVVSLLEWYRP